MIKSPEDLINDMVSEIVSEIESEIQDTPNPSPLDPSHSQSPNTQALEGLPQADTPKTQAPEPEFVIKTSKVLRPYVGLVYGCPGVGKTTLCSSIPGSIVIDLERGGDGLDCTRITIEEQETPRETIAKIKRAVAFAVKQGFSTIIIDSISVLEDLHERQYLTESKKTTLTSGHGSDYKELYSHIREFIGSQTATGGAMNYLRGMGCNLIFIGHDKERTDTVGDSSLLNTINPRLYKGMSEWVCSQCDFVFYYTFDVIVQEEKLGMSKEKLASTRGRKLITTQEGGIMAKKRFDFIKPVISNPTYKVFTSIFDANKPKANN